MMATAMTVMGAAISVVWGVEGMGELVGVETGERVGMDGRMRGRSVTMGMGTIRMGAATTVGSG